MTFAKVRYYESQLATLTDEQRQQLSDCAVRREAAFIDVPLDCSRAVVKEKKPDEALPLIVAAAKQPCPDCDKSKGLGDTLAKVFKATGVEAAANAFTAVTGVDCGCKKRQQRLNELFPYAKPPDAEN